MTAGAGALAAVDRLLAADAAGRMGRRTAVRLLRAAVEEAVDAVWRSAGRPEVSAASRRAQFLVLPQFLPAQTAADAAALWAGLSAAGHHHAYELTPTAAEVADWRDRTAACLAALREPTGSRS